LSRVHYTTLEVGLSRSNPPTADTLLFTRKTGRVGKKRRTLKKRVLVLC